MMERLKAVQDKVAAAGASYLEDLVRGIEREDLAETLRGLTVEFIGAVEELKRNPETRRPC